MELTWRALLCVSSSLANDRKWRRAHAMCSKYFYSLHGQFVLSGWCAPLRKTLLSCGAFSISPRVWIIL